jgi:hypothetical protein
MNIFLTDHKCGSNLITKLAEIINETIYPYKFNEINSLIPQNHKFIARYMDPKFYDLKKVYRTMNFFFSNACLVRYFYLFWQDYNIFNKYILCIRDPREIIISGYLYHKQCQEIWTINHNYNYYSGWKENHFRNNDIQKNKEYFDFCNLFSKDIKYKEKLLRLDLHDGVMHEMNHVAFLTLTGMNKFNFIEKRNVFIFRLEDFLINFNQTMQKLLDFLKIQENKKKEIYDEVYKFHLKNNQVIKLNAITNYNLDINRHKIFFNKKINNIFMNKYESLLKKYNY